MTRLTELANPRGGDHTHAVLADVAGLAVRVHVASLARLLPEHGEAAPGDAGAGVHTHRAVTAVLVTGALPRVTRVSLRRGLREYLLNCIMYHVFWIWIGSSPESVSNQKLYKTSKVHFIHIVKVWMQHHTKLYVLWVQCIYMNFE